MKEELHSRSTFYKLANSIWNKLYDLIFGHWVYEKDILDLCHEKGLNLYILLMVADHVLLIVN